MNHWVVRLGKSTMVSEKKQGEESDWEKKQKKYHIMRFVVTGASVVREKFTWFVTFPMPRNNRNIRKQL